MCGGRDAPFGPRSIPRRTTSRWYPSGRHEHLATARAPCSQPSRSKPTPSSRRSREYFAQPFEIAEPFTSRPGERTRYGVLLDEVEALLAAT